MGEGGRERRERRRGDQDSFTLNYGLFHSKLWLDALTTESVDLWQRSKG